MANFIFQTLPKLIEPIEEVLALSNLKPSDISKVCTDFYVTYLCFKSLKSSILTGYTKAELLQEGIFFLIHLFA